jgi:predicted enzyme related to lactoylglutathione lyase
MAKKSKRPAKKSSGKPGNKRSARKVAGRSARKVAGRSARKAAGRSTRKAGGSSARKHTPTPGLYGWITHTELVSADPLATKAWAAKVLGWKFQPPMPAHDGGDYHLFAYSDKGGGGIREIKPFETPGSNFTVHVSDCQEAFDKAVREGAEAMMPPTRIMEGVTIAMVRAPGGVPVGLAGP